MDEHTSQINPKSKDLIQKVVQEGINRLNKVATNRNVQQMRDSMKGLVIYVVEMVKKHSKEGFLMMPDAWRKCKRYINKGLSVLLLNYVFFSDNYVFVCKKYVLCR